MESHGEAYDVWLVLYVNGGLQLLDQFNQGARDSWYHTALGLTRFTLA